MTTAQWCWNKIVALAARLDVVSTTSPTRNYQIGGSEDGQTWSDPATIYQHYGFRSRPGANAQVVTVALRGATSQRVIVADEVNGTAPQDLEDGEVALYSSAGQVVLLDKDGQVSITTSAGAQVQIDSAGNVTVVPSPAGKVRLGDGNPASLDQVALVTALEAQLNAAIAVFNAHTHAVPVVGVTTGMATVNATSATPSAAQVPVAGIGSSNVVAKK